MDFIVLSTIKEILNEETSSRTDEDEEDTFDRFGRPSKGIYREMVLPDTRGRACEDEYSPLVPTSPVRSHGKTDLVVITEPSTPVTTNRSYDLGKLKWSSHREPPPASYGFDEDPANIFTDGASNFRNTAAEDVSTLESPTLSMSTDQRSKLEMCPVCSLPVQYTDLAAKPTGQRSVIICQSSTSGSHRSLGTFETLSMIDEEYSSHAKQYYAKTTDNEPHLDNMICSAPGWDFMRPFKAAVEDFVTGYCDPMYSAETRQDGNTVNEYESKNVPPYCANCRAYIIRESPEDLQAQALNNLSSWLAATDSEEDGRPGNGKITVILDHQAGGGNSMVSGRPGTRFESSSGEPLQWDQLMKDTTAPLDPARASSFAHNVDTSSWMNISPHESPGRAVLSPRSRRYRRMLEEHEVSRQQPEQATGDALIATGPIRSSKMRESRSLPKPRQTDTSTSPKQCIKNSNEAISEPWEIVQDESPTKTNHVGEPVIVTTLKEPLTKAKNAGTDRGDEPSMEGSSVWQSVSSGSLSVHTEDRGQRMDRAEDEDPVDELETLSPVAQTPRLPSTFGPRTLRVETLGMPNSNVVQQMSEEETSANVARQQLSREENSAWGPALEQCSTKDEEMMIIGRYEEKRQIATKAIGRKLMEDYILTQEQCEQCQMPLMQRDGILECVVCPLVSKKAKKRAEIKRNEILTSPRSEAQSSGFFGSEYESPGPRRPLSALARRARDTLSDTSVTATVGAMLALATQWTDDPYNAPTGMGEHYDESKLLDQHRSSYPSVVQQALDMKRGDWTRDYASSPGTGALDKPHDTTIAVSKGTEAEAMSVAITAPQVEVEYYAESSSGEWCEETVVSDTLEAQEGAYHTMFNDSFSIEVGGSRSEVGKSRSDVEDGRLNNRVKTEPYHYVEPGSSVGIAQVDWQLEPTARICSEKEEHEKSYHKMLNDPNPRVNCGSRSNVNEYRLENKRRGEGGKSRTTSSHARYVPEETGTSEICQQQDLVKPTYDMDQASQEVYTRLLQGWLLTNSNCEQCFAPMMQSSETNCVECVFCGDFSRVSLQRPGEARDQDGEGQVPAPTFAEDSYSPPVSQPPTFDQSAVSSLREDGNGYDQTSQRSDSQVASNTPANVASKDLCGTFCYPQDRTESEELAKVIGFADDLTSKDRVQNASNEMVGFDVETKTLSPQQARYLVIPDDFDFDDSHAVMQLIAAAKKKHKTSQKENIQDCRHEVESDIGHADAVNSSHRHIRVDRGCNVQVDPYGEQRYTAASQMQNNNSVWKPEIPKDSSTKRSVPGSATGDDDSFGGLSSSITRVNATTGHINTASPRIKATMQPIEETAVKIAPQRMPRWEDYVNDIAPEPSGLVLQYKHNIGVNAHVLRHDPLRSLEPTAVAPRADGDSALKSEFLESRHKSFVQRTNTNDELVFEIMQDTEDMVMNYDGFDQTSNINPSRTKSTQSNFFTQLSPRDRVSPSQGRKLSAALSPEQEAEEIVKKFQMELVMPPADPKYTFNEANRNMTVSPTSCLLCGKPRRFFASSIDEVCGTAGCQLFMIPDDAVEAFTYANRVQTSGNMAYSDPNIRSPVTSKKRFELYRPVQGRSQDSFRRHRDFDDSESGNRANGIHAFGGDVMSDIMSRMNLTTSLSESPKKKPISGQDLEEEMDLEVLIKRLASAAKAIQDLEHDVESPRHGYGGQGRST